MRTVTSFPDRMGRRHGRFSQAPRFAQAKISSGENGSNLLDDGIKRVFTKVHTSPIKAEVNRVGKGRSPKRSSESGFKWSQRVEGRPSGPTRHNDPARRQERCYAGALTFEFYRLRFRFRAAGELHFPPYKSGNIVRGAFGSIFRKLVCMPSCREARNCEVHSTCPYALVFEPQAACGEGPSGLADWPRPFVFRAAHLDGSTVREGEAFHFDIHIFDVQNPALAYFVLSFAQLAREGLGPGRGRAESLAHQGQLPSTTFSFNLPEGVSLSDATNAINKAELDIGMPASITGKFAGTAQQFQNSLSNQPILIGTALLAVYIILGILYESLLHPLTIISTLPFAGVGALIALVLFRTELTIVALIGIILLIGIVKKNAINDGSISPWPPSVTRV